MSNILSTLNPPSPAAPAKPVEDCASCRIIGGLTAVGLGTVLVSQAVGQGRTLRAGGPVKGGPTKGGLWLMGAVGAGAIMAGLGRFAGLRWKDGEVLTVPEYKARVQEQA